MRTTGTYVTTTTLGEAVQAFVPRALPAADPPLAAVVSGREGNSIVMVRRERFEPDAETLERNRRNSDHRGASKALHVITRRARSGP